MKLHPGEVASPTVDVDTFWHYHILDTMKCAADCAQAFGYFLHHDPHVGAEDCIDAPVRTESGERMRTLYEMVFGEAYAGACADDAVVAQSWCAGPGQSPVTHDAGRALACCAGPGQSPMLHGGAMTQPAAVH